MRVILIEPDYETASYLEVEDDNLSSWIKDIVGDNSNMIKAYEKNSFHQFYIPSDISHLEGHNEFTINLFIYQFGNRVMGPFGGNAIFITSDGHGSAIDCNVDIDEFNKKLTFIEGKIKSRENKINKIIG